MENSGKIFFDDDSPQWYIALGTEWVGPLSASDVYARIQKGQITWAHFVWRKGQAEWKRICDTKTFQAVVPQQPSKGVQKEIKTALKPGLRPRGGPPSAPAEEVSLIQNWYLYYNHSQYGPFSEEEILRFLKVGKIDGRAHCWRDGMKNWERLDRVSEFKKISSRPLQGSSHSSAQSQTAGLNTEQRAAPRRPLVAKILMTDEQSVIVGVCRDISVGGLQVLTHRIPANVGAKLKMNISPSSNESGDQIEPFVAEGVIVRILEDGRGFSFRFERLSERARQAIESYFESPN